MRPPLSVRRKPDSASSYQALQEGIPAWLGSSLLAWTDSQFVQNGVLGSEIEVEMLLAAERTLHIRLDWSSGPGGCHRNLRERMIKNPDLFLDVIDFTLDWVIRRPGFEAERAARRLEQFLSEGGSAWQVSKDPDGRFCLERRVDETVVCAAQTCMAEAGRAGELLGIAWHSAYGRQPEPSRAYREAVRAVEAAAIPVVVPNDSKATLGKIIGAIRSNPERWKVSLSPPPDFEPVAALLGMLDLLWKCQMDRHATPDPAVPLSVSIEEARAAVHLAVTLVHWFSTGVVGPATA